MRRVGTVKKRTLGMVGRITAGFLSTGAALSMAGVFLVVFVNSVRRYTLGKSFEWGEELPVYLGVYGVMFGAALAYLQDRHVRFMVVVGFLPRRVCQVLFLVVDLAMVCIGAGLTRSGYLFMAKRGDIEASGIIGPAKRLKALSGIDVVETLGFMAPYQAAMVLGGVLVTVAAALKFLERITGGGKRPGGSG
jgi:TRAP-type C4-dicarboxylate transport system permease small subunit